jgi:hypothetical protein
MTHPLGLIVLAAAAALPFCLWSRTLGTCYPAVGARPYVAGYAASLVGLTLLSFVSAFMEFDDRVAAGLLRDAERWTIVPGWTMYITILALMVVLPLLGAVGVPVVASLLKRGHFSVRNIILILTALWLALAVASWAFPGNEWHRTHRFASFTTALTHIFPVLAMVALPFTLAIHRATRAFRQRPT